MNHWFLKPDIKVGDEEYYTIPNCWTFKISQFIRYYLTGHFLKLIIRARWARFKRNYIQVYVNSWKDRKYRSFWKGVKSRK